MVNIIFVVWKLICVPYVFFHAEFKYISRITVSPTGFVRQFFNVIITSVVFVITIPDVLNMAEALYYISNVVLA
jgi:hypothetical protein